MRKGWSTKNLLTAVVDDWLLAREKKLFTAVVFIDLSKAFDNVQHQTSLIMLQRYQVGGTVLKWLYNYLEGRNQRILLGNSLSEPFNSTKGVPRVASFWATIIGSAEALPILCVRYNR